MDELVPTEDDIERVAKKLHNHRSGGASGIQDKHLKGLLMAARKKEKEKAAAEQDNLIETMPGPNRMGREGTEESREKTPEEASYWDRVVDIIQTAFGEGQLEEESPWQAVVLITKGKRTNKELTSWRKSWKVVAAI